MNAKDFINKPTLKTAELERQGLHQQTDRGGETAQKLGNLEIALENFRAFFRIQRPKRENQTSDLPSESN